MYTQQNLLEIHKTEIIMAKLWVEFKLIIGRVILKIM